ncbi:alpha-(1-2)-phosphatidylinositol mannosyltransferase [Corynebacterium sp. 13CS0277]|uniref:glycosyltransferase family 4 protein n=1 Tax=Corynebacterium sp. 13CS0277 TaxID=2071994 RepID=UPI000D023973|nr:glycosyltransferase family 4 protein [Corynebacterium sp. 13CS0277]PRQ12002.1 alpha-(1-2)-phosphatidylinositol mannosyltransferase [Corynebacterium sp. 13CS0277]
MRIGIVCPYSFDEPGGVQAHILDLAEYFLAQGHVVRVLGPCSAETQVPDFVVKGGPSIPIPYNGSVARLSIGPQVRRNIRTFIEEGQFDVVHVHEPNSPSYSMATLVLCEGPIVATYHASSSKSVLLKVAYPALKPILEKVHGGIAVSEMARRWQVEQVGSDPVLIPNGVDTRRFAAAATAVEDYARRGRSIVFLGRIDEQRKGLDVLLPAFAAVREVFPDATLTVIGAGTPRPQDGVRYVGRVDEDEKARLLGQAAVYCAPNLGGESFGIVLVEAMASGACVVASDLEAFVDVAEGSSETPAARLFPTGDVRALADTLIEVLGNPEAASALAARGRVRARRFDWSRVAEDIFGVYQTVAGSGPVTFSRARAADL